MPPQNLRCHRQSGGWKVPPWACCPILTLCCGVCMKEGGWFCLYSRSCCACYASLEAVLSKDAFGKVGVVGVVRRTSCVVRRASCSVLVVQEMVDGGQVERATNREERERDGEQRTENREQSDDHESEVREGATLLNSFQSGISERGPAGWSGHSPAGRMAQVWCPDVPAWTRLTRIGRCVRSR